MELTISGIGHWSQSHSGWAALRDHLRYPKSQEPKEGEGTPPAGLIPARERRRAPLLVKLAAEVAEQATGMSLKDPARLLTVFASGMGDVQTTDLMCRALAAPEKIISPTHFHNSVHNAAAGYWSIGAGCHWGSTSISGFRWSVGVALLEAASLCVIEQRPVMAVFVDIGTRPPLDAICEISGPFGVALILEPAFDVRRPKLAISVTHGRTEDIEPTHTWSQVRGNPVVAILDFLALIARDMPGEVMFQIGEATCLGISLAPPEEPEG